MSRRVRTMLLLVVIAMLPAQPALAWKLETHIWLASKLVGELRSSSCNVTIAPFGNHSVRKNVCEAILANEGAFLLGVLGADIYPDMVSGQFTTHPGVEQSPTAVARVRAALQPLGRTFTIPRLWHTDDWLDHVRTGADSPAEIAFAHGYMIHAAMDMWAHTYVNIYAGGVFSLADEQEVEFRHMALESFIKHTHRSFLEGSAGAGPALRGPTGVTIPQPRVTGVDALTPLTAPIAFVRERLVLNADVAQQYAMQEPTLHLWVMYTYWNEVRSLTTRIQPLLTAATQVRKALDTAINQSNEAFKVAQSGYLQAKLAYDAAVKNYESLMKQHGKGNPLVQTAKGVMDGARRTLDDAVKALEPLKLQRDMRTAVSNIERDAQNLTKGPIDQWRQHLERAVDAYILAWQDTSKELMRPKPTALSVGNDPTGPLTRWAACWGSTFGLPVSALSANCSTSVAGYQALNDTLRQWAKDTLVQDQNLRKLILDLERDVNRIAEGLVIQSGVEFSKHFNDKGVAAGYTRSLVKLRSKETPDPASLDAEFRDNTSNKKLVIYAPVKFSDVVLTDIGGGELLKQMPHDAELDGDLKKFAALQNSMTMSKLTLLGGAELNGLVTAAMKSSASQTGPVVGGVPGVGRDLSAMFKPLYAANDPAGIVLIGALRSIDGDHQWQRVAPPLPPTVGVLSADGPVADALSRRTSGTGRTVTVPANCRVYGYDARDAGKGGLRLWQNTAARRAVFNKIFQAPLTPGLSANSKALNLVLSQGLAGIGSAADGAYPPSTATAGCGPGL